jgi:hypothetical protein
MPIPRYLQVADEEVLASIIIEDGEGVRNADEIVGTPSLDLAIIGPGDLATSLGHRLSSFEARRENPQLITPPITMPTATSRTFHQPKQLTERPPPRVRGSPWVMRPPRPPDTCLRRSAPAGYPLPYPSPHGSSDGNPTEHLLHPPTVRRGQVVVPVWALHAKEDVPRYRLSVLQDWLERDLFRAGCPDYLTTFVQPVPQESGVRGLLGILLADVQGTIRCYVRGGTRIGTCCSSTEHTVGTPHP